MRKTAIPIKKHSLFPLCMETSAYWTLCLDIRKRRKTKQEVYTKINLILENQGEFISEWFKNKLLDLVELNETVPDTKKRT